MLQQAQQAAASAGIERVFTMAGNLLAAKPDVMDCIDVDYGIDKYSELLNNDPKLIRSPDAVASIREQRQKQEQEAAQAEQITALSAAGKNLGQTEVGGGINALQMMGGVSP